MSLKSSLLLPAAILTLQACVFVPRTTEVYDFDCRVSSRQMDLQAVEIGGFGRCQSRDCAVILVAVGATAAASAVVSGSIVVVGNVVYWLEKQGRCQRES
jgi:hypothetical protein